MRIRVNSTDADLMAGNFLSDLMMQLKLNDKRGIAVAVNSVVVTKKKWDEFELKEEDQVIIIEAAQGG